MRRREFLHGLWAAGAVVKLASAQSEVFFERQGAAHAGKVLAAIQPHADDVPLYCAGTVAKLLHEGYTGYLIRATNDDMGDDIGESGSIGENVLRNEREVAALTRAMGLKRDFSLNYLNHRMAVVPQTELQVRLIFLFRLLKVDTVFCYDPWAHDEENPDHYVLGHAVEAACWMAGRDQDFPEQFAAGLTTHAVSDKYYYARHPAVTRVVDISPYVDVKVEANRCNVAKGPGGHHGAKLRAELAQRHLKLPLLGDDDATADRAYIKEFVLARDRELGKKYGVGYAEAFHYIGTAKSRLEEYIRQHAVPLQ